MFCLFPVNNFTYSSHFSWFTSSSFFLWTCSHNLFESSFLAILTTWSNHHLCILCFCNWLMMVVFLILSLLVLTIILLKNIISLAQNQFRLLEIYFYVSLTLFLLHNVELVRILPLTHLFLSFFVTSFFSTIASDSWYPILFWYKSQPSLLLSLGTWIPTFSSLFHPGLC